MRLSCLVAFALLLFYGQACSAAISDEVFAFDGVKIGVTTLAEVQARYGKTKMVRTAKEDGAPVAGCYYFAEAKQRMFIIFESGALGGWDRVTALRISTKPMGNDCVSTKDNVAITPGHGVRLGQNVKEFKQKVDVVFKRTGNTLGYIGESKRAATAEEMKRMQAVFPGEKQIEFDVVVIIKAKFDANRLTDYRVSKTESF